MSFLKSLAILSVIILHRADLELDVLKGNSKSRSTDFLPAAQQLQQRQQQNPQHQQQQQHQKKQIPQQQQQRRQQQEQQHNPHLAKTISNSRITSITPNPSHDNARIHVQDTHINSGNLLVHSRKDKEGTSLQVADNQNQEAENDASYSNQIYEISSGLNTQNFKTSSNVPDFAVVEVVSESTGDFGGAELPNPEESKETPDVIPALKNNPIPFNEKVTELNVEFGTPNEEVKTVLVSVQQEPGKEGEPILSVDMQSKIVHQEVKVKPKEEKSEEYSKVEFLQSSQIPVHTDTGSSHGDSSSKPSNPENHENMEESFVQPITSEDGIENYDGKSQLQDDRFPANFNADIGFAPTAEVVDGKPFDAHVDAGKEQAGEVPNKETPLHLAMDEVVLETVSSKSQIFAPNGTTSSGENESLNISSHQPSSVQPPPHSGVESLADGVPTTAVVPGKAKSDDDQKSIEELEVPSEMPSFDEWKQKEKEKSKHLEAEQTIQSAVPPVKAKGSKKRVNYASVTCGAKIVGANQEAQNPSSILIENKDQYMINPCKAKKVFTVELCEPIQVQAIDIGNLELFSSLPQSFDVHVSDRFPTKEWKALGRFQARDERTIQTFQVDDSLIFAKYIRIEMLSHYGVEHYCPLSILRVFGTTLDEDDDADENETENTDILDEETVIDSFAENNPTNLFASATDTVLSLVKTVLNPSIESDDRDDSSLASSDSNLSSISSLDKKKTVEPCTPEASHGTSEVAQETIEVENESHEFQPTIPDSVVDANNQLSEHEQNKGSVPSHEQLRITLIEAAGMPLKEIISACAFCNNDKVDFCLFDRSTVCGYYRAMSFVDSQSCVYAQPNLEKDSQPKSGASPEKYTSVVQQNLTVQRSEETESNVNLMINNSGAASERKESDLPVILESRETTYEEVEFTEAGKLQSTGIVIPSSTRNDKPVAMGESSTADHPTSGSESNAGDDFQRNLEQENNSRFGYVPSSRDHETKRPETMSEKETSASTSSESDMKSKHQEQGQMARDQGVQDLPVQDQSVPVQTVQGEAMHSLTAQGHTAQDMAQTQTAQGQIVQGQVAQGQSQEQFSAIQGQTKALMQKLGEQTAANKQTSDKEDTPAGQGSGTPSNIRMIYAEISSKPEVAKDYELDAVAMDEITYQKLSSRGKESAFIKLKNRMKLLEMNLNLTNRYLEELSQRYKRQMEEMHSSLNRTITKLSNMAKTAEDRDMKQQDHIASLETTVENLTTMFMSVEHSIESLQRQMIERHLCLMALEILVFAGVLIFCLNRRNIQLECDQNPKTMQVEPVPRPVISGGIHDFRRKSVDSQLFRNWSFNPIAPDKNSVEELNVTEEVTSHPPGATKAGASSSTVTGAVDFPKKRKKKKFSHLRSLSPSATRPKKLDLAIPNHSPATGLIFGTCKDNFNQSKSLDVNIENSAQSHHKRLSLDSSSYKPWRWIIFGSNQDQKSAVPSAVSCSETMTKMSNTSLIIQKENICNGVYSNSQSCATKNSGSVCIDRRLQSQTNEACCDTQLQNKLMTKKVTSRGRPVAD